MALWILPKRGLLCVGAKANVPLCGGKKLNKKMCGREKKKYRRVGKVCRLSSCPFVIWSVCLCLSVKMVYASLVCLTVTVRVARSLSLRLQLTTLYPMMSLKKKHKRATKRMDSTLKAYCCKRGIWSKRVDNFSIYFS